MEPHTIVIGQNFKHGSKTQRPPTTKPTRPVEFIDAVVDGTGIRQVMLSQTQRFSWRLRRMIRNGELSIHRSNNGNRIADFGYGSLWYQPSVEAFNFAFDWIDKASDKKDPPPFGGIDGPEEPELHVLIDRYAASLCLDLHPLSSFTKIEAVIEKRLTEQSISLAQIKWLHERLPVDHRFIELVLGRIAEIQYYIWNEDAALGNNYRKVYNLQRYSKIAAKAAHENPQRDEALAQPSSAQTREPTNKPNTPGPSRQQGMK